MKFHKESSSIFNTAKFNKHKAQIFIICSAVVYVILAIFLIYQWSLTVQKVNVVVAKKMIYRNQIITADCIESYPMTKKEYLKYATLQNDKTGKIVGNKLVLWDADDNKIAPKDKNVNKIIGLYSVYTKAPGEFLRWDQFVASGIDYSRLILSKYPGKNIVELDISTSNLNTFKKTLKVGDKINIGCSYKSDATINLTARNTNSERKSMDVSTVVVNDLFPCIEIADILNSDGESLLDYFTYLERLPYTQRLQVENTDEYAKKTKVNNLFLALTPQEEKEYRNYAKKEGIQFYISLPQIDE